MSALEEYRESQVWYQAPNNPGGMVEKDLADAAIVELEAGNQKYYRKWQDEILRRAVAEGRAAQYLVLLGAVAEGRAEQAEDALAERDKEILRLRCQIISESGARAKEGSE